jgi:hypothetical protein
MFWKPVKIFIGVLDCNLLPWLLVDSIIRAPVASIITASAGCCLKSAGRETGSKVLSPDFKIQQFKKQLRDISTMMRYHERL